MPLPRKAVSGKTMDTQEGQKELWDLHVGEGHYSQYPHTSLNFLISSYYPCRKEPAILFSVGLPKTGWTINFSF